MGMQPDISRRGLLFGAKPSRPLPQRPPGALREDLFVEACTSCGACIADCPEHILVAEKNGRPLVDFSQGNGECTFCGACADACKVAAFLPAASRAEGPSWSWRAAIGDTCLTSRGIMCQSCKDACPHGAIRFAYAPGSVAQPVLETALCTGCGACYAPCPVAAISFHSTETADVR